MPFEWDERKNQSNIKKHGVSFEQATAVFESSAQIYFDADSSLDEDRYVAVGFSEARMLAVVFVYRNDDKIRIISARKASLAEEKKYERGY